MPGSTPTAGSVIDANTREYNPAELEFMFAMDRWKRRHAGVHPTCRDILAVVQHLGYVRLKEAAREE